MIKTLSTRYPELGRIRLGEKGPKGQPIKGEFLRFSSNDEVTLQALASQLGGTVTPWPNGEQTLHLTTESASVDVYLPPDPVETAYELWSRAGCTRRCDGVRCNFLNKGDDGEFIDTDDCLCLAEGRTPGDKADKESCNVTVRLRLVIPDVPGVGVWICTSHSIYAAMELPGQIDVLQTALGGIGLIPATFAIEKRSEKKPWEKYKREYIVPVLRVRKSLAQLVAGAQNGELVGAHAAVDTGSRRALQAGSIPAAGSGPQAAPVAQPTSRSDAARPSPKPATPPDEPAGSATPTGSGGPSPVFVRSVRAAARRAWPASSGISDEQREAQLTEVVRETLYELRQPKDAPAWTADDISGPEEGNAVMAALGKDREAS